MPVDNPYFIPKENFPKVEEVREFKEEINPAYRQFIAESLQERQQSIVNKSKLSSAAQSKVIKRYGSDYLSERAFTNDLALMEMYGPGWGEWILKTTIVVGGGFVLGPVPAMVVGGLTAGGAKIAENAVDDEDAKKVFGFISDCGMGVATGGAVGAAVQGVGAVVGGSDLVGLGSSAGKTAAMETFKKTGDFALARIDYLTAAAKHGAKVAGDIDKWFSLCKDAGVAADEADKHLNHVKAGYSYKSGCKVCEA